MKSRYFIFGLRLVCFIGTIFSNCYETHALQAIDSTDRWSSEVDVEFQKRGQDLANLGDHETSAKTLGGDDPLHKQLPAPSITGTKSESMLSAIDTKQKKAIAKMVGGLAIVVAVFMVIAMIFGKRKTGVGADRELVDAKTNAPLEILYRSALSNNQQMQLVRLGNRLLLVASSENRADTLAEITDPAEVAEIETMVKQGDFSFLGRRQQAANRRRITPFSRRQPVYEA
ncbi:MAG TPA: flagellar biosynthetic protein FliO [Pirellulaceae bacterium]|nr:flagellar biosynthetic protein FliO [Pirellulaceae bacterium]HMO92636.1 flagellar biosynthetic protein FliO [Pirellulaceae bacterium]HMP70216.1 flagellar biosynthetic protein FliO [Pirellulaceae bacterium]